MLLAFSLLIPGAQAESATSVALPPEQLGTQLGGEPRFRKGREEEEEDFSGGPFAAAAKEVSDGTVAAAAFGRGGNCQGHHRRAAKAEPEALEFALHETVADSL